MKHGLILLLAGTALSTRAANPAILTQEFIFETAPFPSCHASTLVETTNGLVAAWFGGKHEKAPDVGIWTARRTADGWSSPVEVANGVQPDGTRHPCWNPVLFQPNAGPLLLFYKVGPDPKSWWGLLRTSADSGQSWSAPRRLAAGIAGPIKNKPVQLADGTLLSPTSSEDQGWRVHFEQSSDLGKTWSATAPVNDGTTIGAIQPSILFDGNKRLIAIGRTRQGRVFHIVSEDAGKTWGAMTLLDLPNPNAGTDALTLRDGRHLLVYNNTTSGRTPLTIALSADGVTWRKAFDLETDRGEYSYPAVIQTRDGLVHISYTWKRERIRHVVLSPAALPVVTP